MISDYSTLQTEIANWLKRTDLTDEIKTFIQLAEIRIKQKTRVQWTQQHSYSETTAGTESLSLPSDFNGMIGLYLNSDPRYQLSQMSIEALRDAYPEVSTGKPTAFAMSDQGIVFAPIPDSTYSVRMNYYAFSALSDSNTTNTVLTRYPTVYLYQSLAEAAGLLHDDQRQMKWSQMAQVAMDQIEQDENDLTWGASVREVLVR